MTNAKLEQIATEILAGIRTNPNGFTVETLIANWERGIEWLGFKVGGKAWQRELFSAARAGWIASLKTTSVVLPPSEETLAWGGFLGGEIIPVPAMYADAEAEFTAKYGVAL